MTTRQPLNQAPTSTVTRTAESQSEREVPYCAQGCVSLDSLWYYFF